MVARDGQVNQPHQDEAGPDLELRGRSGEGPVRAAPWAVRLHRRRLRGRVHHAPQRRGLRGARVAAEAGDLPRADRHGHRGARHQARHAGDDRPVRRHAPRAPRGRHRSRQSGGELRPLPHHERGLRVPARGDRRLASRAEVVPALPAGVASADGVARPPRSGGWLRCHGRDRRQRHGRLPREGLPQRLLLQHADRPEEHGQAGPAGHHSPALAVPLLARRHALRDLQHAARRRRRGTADLGDGPHGPLPLAHLGRHRRGSGPTGRDRWS